VTASGQDLEVIGELQVTLKIHGFSWPWIFLVSKKLQGVPILGADFIRKMQMVLDLAKARIYFSFAPEKCFYLCKSKGGPLYSHMQPLSPKLPKVQCGKMSVS
jgi:hypothetical protein